MPDDATSFLGPPAWLWRLLARWARSLVRRELVRKVRAALTGDFVVSVLDETRPEPLEEVCRRAHLTEEVYRRHWSMTHAEYLAQPADLVDRRMGALRELLFSPQPRDPTEH
ncbi:MAG: hypothetical protein ACRDYC_07630 [Acidimicrobiales bacterium]